MAYKLVVTVPLSHADVVRAALGEAGAGVIGGYTHCSFSSRGVGRYVAPVDGQPFIGKAGEASAVEEERVEVTVPASEIETVIEAMKAAHPYEEVAYDVYKLEDF